MKGAGYKRRRGKSRFKNFGLTLVFLLILLIIIYGVYKLFFIPAPVIEGTEAFNLLSADKSITLNGKNLKSIDIFINQGDKSFELLRDMPEITGKIYTLQIKPKDLGLKDGSAVVIIKARAGILKEVKYEINSMIDTVPPTLEVLRAPSIIYQGSGGFALLRAKDAESVFVKLVVPTLQEQSRDSLTFRGFKAPAETGSKPTSRYFVFFPAPFDIKEESVFYAVARDAAGNQNTKPLPIRLKTKRYKTSSVTVDDSFINQVVLPLLNEADISDPVSAFKRVNGEWRKNIQKRIIQITQETGSKVLWKGRFLQLKNSKVMATYGDKRTYFYNGKLISKSVHLGYDLASTANAPVEAANAGVVRFTGDIGIYGNTVIIDHGLGLMSLYGHMSMIMAKEGQAVNKGDIIGKTGSTGLASGDHLHFGILIHGYEVSPLHWWDTHWLKVNVLDYISSY